MMIIKKKLYASKFVSPTLTFPSLTHTNRKDKYSDKNRVQTEFHFEFPRLSLAFRVQKETFSRKISQIAYDFP